MIEHWLSSIVVGAIAITAGVIFNSIIRAFQCVILTHFHFNLIGLGIWNEREFLTLIKIKKNILPGCWGHSKWDPLKYCPRATFTPKWCDAIAISIPFAKCILQPVLYSMHEHDSKVGASVAVHFSFYFIIWANVAALSRLFTHK